MRYFGRDCGTEGNRSFSLFVSLLCPKVDRSVWVFFSAVLAQECWFEAWLMVSLSLPPQSLIFFSATFAKILSVGSKKVRPRPPSRSPFHNHRGLKPIFFQRLVVKRFRERIFAKSARPGRAGGDTELFNRRRIQQEQRNSLQQQHESLKRLRDLQRHSKLLQRGQNHQRLAPHPLTKQQP